MQESPQPASVPVELPKAAAPAATKRSGWMLATVALVMLLLVSVLGLGWAAYQAYILNTELASSQEQLTVLQSNHDKLQAEYTTLKSENEKLNADLAQSRTDLEKANFDLTNAQTGLDDSKAQNEGLATQIDTAGDLAEVLYVMAISESDSDILKIDRLITEAGNTELTKHWDTFTGSPSEEAFETFFTYLIFATRESLR